ncbi:MAG: rhodanese-like domain-containing protein [Gammaproteobacteria bacterium]
MSRPESSFSSDAPPREPLRFTDLIARCLDSVEEIFPWDLAERLADSGATPLLLDIREPYEFEAMHIAGSINVPRGILETACEYGYEETVPELVAARERPIVVICRSGNRSVLAAHVMQLMGYRSLCSLKTGLKGWNDFEQPMIDAAGSTVDVDDADEYFTPRLRPEQLGPKRN